MEFIRTFITFLPLNIAQSTICKSTPQAKIKYIEGSQDFIRCCPAHQKPIERSLQRSLLSTKDDLRLLFPFPMPRSQFYQGSDHSWNLLQRHNGATGLFNRWILASLSGSAQRPVCCASKTLWNKGQVDYTASRAKRFNFSFGRLFFFVSWNFGNSLLEVWLLAGNLKVY